MPSFRASRKAVTRISWADDSRPTYEHARRLTRRDWTDFSPEARLLARALHDAWRDEALIEAQFVSPRHVLWADLPAHFRILFGAMAERALSFQAEWAALPEAHRALVTLEAQ